MVEKSDTGDAKLCRRVNLVGPGGLENDIIDNIAMFIFKKLLFYTFFLSLEH